MTIENSENYVAEHLIPHLLHAKQFDRAYKLLLNNPAWLLTISGRFGGDQSTMDDIQIVLRHLSQVFEVAHLSLLIGLHMVRYVIEARVKVCEDKDICRGSKQPVEKVCPEAVLRGIV